MDGLQRQAAGLQFINDEGRPGGTLQRAQPNRRRVKAGGEPRKRCATAPPSDQRRSAPDTVSLVRRWLVSPHAESDKSCPTVSLAVAYAACAWTGRYPPTRLNADAAPPRPAWRMRCRDHRAALPGIYRPYRSRASRSRVPQVAHRRVDSSVHRQSGPDRLAIRRARVRAR